MDRNEIEREILEACDRVSGARERYRKFNEVEDTIRSIAAFPPVAQARGYREAKEILADLVRERALSEDRLWRAVVEGAADRIAASFKQKLDDLHNAILVEQTKEIEAIELLRQLYDRVRGSAINYGDFSDLMEEIETFLDPGPDPSPRNTEGDLRLHDPEGKA